MEVETIIVGSGVAAAALARGLLAADPQHSLLVLEAGPKVPVKDRRMWWDYVVNNVSPYEQCHDLPLANPKSPGDPFENQLIHGDEQPDGTREKTEWGFRESRMMGYGGSTYHWGGWGLRFKPEDFKLYKATGRGADWPIDYEDLERYYCAAERLLSVAGDSNDPWFQKDRNGKKLRSQPYPLPPFEHTAADGPMIAAFEKNGMPFAPMPVARYRRCMTTGTCKYCPIGARFLAASIFDELVESKRHPNLHVQVRSPVSQLLMHGKNRIAGVGYLDTATGHTRKAFAERVIVCSGAYESPKLLLRSQSTHWPNGVGNTYEHVGRYLISHPLLFVRGKTADNPHRLQQELDFPTLMSRHYDNPDEQRDGKLFVYRERTRPRVDLAKHMIAGLERTAIENIVKGPADWEIQGFMEEFANENNRIQLGDGLNRLGLPQTRLRFHRAPGFTEASQRHLGRMRKILEDMNVVVNEVGVLSQRGDHAAATCRMSMCEKTGVVDKNLRVHAVDNLYVCSNAVFPSGAAVNPTLTVTALSLRLAEHLASSFPAVQRAAAQQAAVRGAVQHVGAGQEGQ